MSKDHAGVRLLVKQEPLGADAAETRRGGPHSGACERSDLESTFKDRPAVVLSRRGLLQHRHKFVCRCLSTCLAIGFIILFVLMASIRFDDDVSVGLGSQAGNEHLSSYAEWSVSVGLGSQTGSEHSSSFAQRSFSVGPSSWTGKEDNGSAMISLKAGPGSRTGKGGFVNGEKDVLAGLGSQTGKELLGDFDPPPLPLPDAFMNSTYVTKQMTPQQHQQIIQTDIVWSGCATYSVVHPLRVVVNLGSLRIPAMVDTGSDYDALDRDLSVYQSEELGNTAFRKRNPVCETVQGFSGSLKAKSEYTSQWLLSLTGAPVHDGRSETVTVTVTFTEFANLGDPIIIGMPTIDRYGGLELMRRYCWVVGVWVPRFFPSKRAVSKGAVQSMSPMDLGVGR